MKIIVTRPRLEADAWVKQLRTLHLDAVALPLIQISAPLDKNETILGWENLLKYSAVMFVSSNAVRYFFESNIDLGDIFVEKLAIKNIVKNNIFKTTKNIEIKLRMWATGPGTREALLAQFVPADMIDAPATDAAQFDSEALWSRVRNQVKQGDKVLIVRGNSAEAATSGRPWLADQLTAAGAKVDMVVSYQRSAPVFDEAELALMAQASTDGSIWLFSSSEAVANLNVISSLNWSKARAIATHARIAQVAREVGFGVVYESRPTLADVAASIESHL